MVSILLALHRPYIDPTSTSHRPHIDPYLHLLIFLILMVIFLIFLIHILSLSSYLHLPYPYLFIILIFIFLIFIFLSSLSLIILPLYWYVQHNLGSESSSNGSEPSSNGFMIQWFTLSFKIQSYDSMIHSMIQWFNHKIESLNHRVNHWIIEWILNDRVNHWIIKPFELGSEPFELDSEPKLCWTYQYSGRIIKDKEDKKIKMRKIKIRMIKR